jgi:hypothetical protein
MYKHELKINLSQSSIITFIVLVSFISITMNLKYINFFSQKETDTQTQEIFAVDLDISAQVQKQNSKIETDAAYLETDPDLLMLKLRPAKYLANSTFDSFLKKLSGKNVQTLSQNDIKTQTVDLSQSKKVSSSSVNYNAILNKEDNEDKVVSYKDLKSVISKNYGIFQKCYENVLIKDELLSGNASILLKIGSSAKVNFKGVGQNQYKKELESCLANKAKTIHFPATYKGNKIKFSLFFNS